MYVVMAVKEENKKKRNANKAFLRSERENVDIYQDVITLVTLVNDANLTQFDYSSAAARGRETILVSSGHLRPSLCGGNSVTVSGTAHDAGAASYNIMRYHERQDP